MKMKITDLMDLYEDRHDTLGAQSALRNDTEQGARELPAGEEAPVEVTQRRSRFGWKEGLALAAALAVVVLGAFSAKRLLEKSRPNATDPTQALETTHEPRTQEWTPLEFEERQEISRFLSFFAMQNFTDYPQGVTEDSYGFDDPDQHPGIDYAELVHQAFVWRRNYDPESITVREYEGELWDTLTLDQVNETLERILGKRVKAPQSLSSYFPVFYRDGCLWDTPLEGDSSFAFAVAAQSLPHTNPNRRYVSFTVYKLRYELWGEIDLNPLPALSDEELFALLAEEKITAAQSGIALLERGEQGWRLLSISAEPYQGQEIPASMSVDILLTAFARQGVEDLDRDLSGEYELARFAHIYAKLNDPRAIRCRETEDGDYETLTLAQVNDILAGLLPDRTLSPAEGTDYTARRGENYAQHERFADGCFWWPAADGDSHTRIAAVETLNYVESGSPARYEGCFRVYDRAPYADDDFDPDYAIGLPVEELDLLVEQNELVYCGTGEFGILQNADGSLLLERYTLWPAPGELEDLEALQAELQALFDDSAGWYARALTGRFAAPEQVDLYALFYDGIPDGEGSAASASAEELRALYGSEQPGGDTDRLSPEAMDRVLQSCFGLSLEQTEKRGLQRFGYLADYDCYYHTHGDTNQQAIRVAGVRKLKDGTVLMSYPRTGTEPSAELVPCWTAALRPVEGGYRLLSNLPGEWNTYASAGELAFLYAQNETPWYSKRMTADGGSRVRQLLLGSDGSLVYAEDGAKAVRYSGCWWLEGDKLLRCELRPVDETGNALGAAFSVRFNCYGDAQQLVLVQRGSRGFADDTDETMLRFKPLVWDGSDGELPDTEGPEWEPDGEDSMENLTIESQHIDLSVMDHSSGFYYLLDQDSDWNCPDAQSERLLTLYADSGVYYRQRTAGSDTLLSLEGVWWPEGNDTLCLRLWQSARSDWERPDERSLGEAPADSFLVRFSCERKDQTLSLVQQSERGFADDAAGTELSFRLSLLTEPAPRRLSDGHDSRYEAERPAELEYWLLEEPEDAAMEKNDTIWVKDTARQFLGRGYAAISQEDGSKTLPERYVLYGAGPYPDLSDAGGCFITRIEITDPELGVFRFHVDESPEAFDELFRDRGYEIEVEQSEDGELHRAFKNGITASFTPGRLIFSVTVSDALGLGALNG